MKKFLSCLLFVIFGAGATWAAAMIVPLPIPLFLTPKSYTSHTVELANGTYVYIDKHRKLVAFTITEWSLYNVEVDEELNRYNKFVKIMTEPTKTLVFALNKNGVLRVLNLKQRGLRGNLETCEKRLNNLKNVGDIINDNQDNIVALYMKNGELIIPSCYKRNY